MKLEKFTKNKKQKRIVIGSIVGILLLIGGITLYRTFALYKIEQSFDVLKGTVPNFRKSDIELAIMLDNEKAEKIPEKGNYKVDISCNKEVDAEWDYYNWKLKVKDIINGTKCDLSFTSVEESEMPEIIVPNYQKISKEKNVTFLNTTSHTPTRTITFDFSEIPNYQDLTANNFVASLSVSIQFNDAGGSPCSSPSGLAGGSPILSLEGGCICPFSFICIISG